MATYLQAKTQIIEELLPFGNSDILDTAVSRAIVASKKFHENLNQYWFLEDTLSVTLTAGQNTFSITSSVVFINNASFLDDSNARFFPVQIPFKEINQMIIQDTPRVQGIPRFFSLFDNTITVYPASRITQELILYATARLPDPPGSASGSTTTAWFTYGLDLIITRAKIIVAENLIRDYTLSQVLRQQESELLAALQTMNDRMQGAGVPTKHI